MLGVPDAAIAADGKSLAVVAHAQHEIVALQRDQHLDLRGLRVAHHIRQRLLQRTEQREVGVGVQRRKRRRRIERGADAAALGEISHQRMQRRAQPQIVE